MNTELDAICNQALLSIHNVKTQHELNNCKSNYLGSTGIISTLLKQIVSKPLATRKEFGADVNTIKTTISNAIQQKKQELTTLKLGKQQNQIDYSLPGRGIQNGNLHPINQIAQRALHLLTTQGFVIVDGPEIETDYYNFTALNMPGSHPARDMHDTFYLTDTLLLRTHTSNVQIRTLQNTPPPCALVSFGKVYRRDFDVTHTPMFHQIEGILVDRNVTIGHLKWLITNWLQALFAQKLNFRFRQSYFPFTEPSLEVDMQCVLCKGAGCRVCKTTGWLEIMGCGLIHPNVLQACNIDSKTYNGLAFGCGADRLTMLLHQIDDLRLMFSGDLQFLQQF